MKRPTVFVLIVAVLSLTGALVVSVWADGLLDDRKKELLATRCTESIDVPVIAIVLNYAGAVLLVISALSLIVLLGVLLKNPGGLTVVWIMVTAFAFVCIALYATLVIASIISPDSNEPISSQYHPCPSRI
ncbi:hypothetical protein [Nocardia sp. R7R-8]|uniref:hypothetical protein n=1 Tax=Nocardia sp. R7R-8 TaxID=3459304 RepID=UPI00403DB3F5